MSKPKLYLAGPMSGIPQFNFPTFEKAAKFLRYLGHDTVSPHECDSEETQKMAWNSPDGKEAPGMGNGAETWGTCLGRDIALIADTVDGICFLPGWKRSRGAKLEALTGLLTNKLFYEYDEQLGPIKVDTFHIRDELREAI